MVEIVYDLTAKAKNAKIVRKLGILPWHYRATASVRLGGEKELLVRLSTLDRGTTIFLIVL
jgi:hypothetical protein